MLAQSEVRVVLNNIGIRLPELYTIYASDTETTLFRFQFSFWNPQFFFFLCSLLNEPNLFMYGYFYV